MVEELRRAVERAQQRPEDEQRHIAQLILEELEDHQWEQLPELAATIAEAHAEAAGDVMDYEEYARQRRQRRS